jgi:hypothetical protein
MALVMLEALMAVVAVALILAQQRIVLVEMVVQVMEGFIFLLRHFCAV